MRDKLLVDLLSRTLYEVVERCLPVELAFKRACKLLKAKLGYGERELAYEKARSIVSDYMKLLCITGSKVRSYRELVRLWFNVESPKTPLPPYCQLSYNAWFYGRIVGLLGREEGEAMLRTLNRRNLWLRVNTLKASVESVLKDLEREGVDYEVDKHFYYMVKILSSPKPLRQLRIVKEFKAIIHDKASAAVVEVLKPEPEDVIIDVTAAPGIKTSLAMMLTENRARIVAADIDVKRLKVMKVLLRKYGVNTSRVELVATDSAYINIRDCNVKVMLDAPCSNTGAVGKDPSIKIHTSYSVVEYYSNIQRRLLENAVKQGNLVVYSTCSVMPEEGELVVKAVVDRCSGLKLVKALPWTSPGYDVVVFRDKLMRLFPHIHGTEGFFIALILHG